MIYNAPDIETASSAMLRMSSKGMVKTETLPAFDLATMQQVIAGI